jgi:hypothetical protein
MGNFFSNPDILAGKAIDCGGEVIRFPDGVACQLVHLGIFYRAGTPLRCPAAVKSIFEQKHAMSTYTRFSEALAAGFSGGLLSNWNEGHIQNTLHDFRLAFDEVGIEVVLCTKQHGKTNTKWLTYIDRTVASASYTAPHRYVSAIEAFFSFAGAMIEPIAGAIAEAFEPKPKVDDLMMACCPSRCSAGDLDCPVCLNPMVASSIWSSVGLSKADAAVTLPCGHNFHSECLRTWLAQKPTCPVCRYDLRVALAQS